MATELINGVYHVTFRENGGGGGGTDPNAVHFTPQTLTDAQKAQARSNIGAGISNFSGSYNDLSNKPTIPTVPELSTNIAADRNSNTKTATPKAVADYVDAQSIGVPVANAIPANGMKANVHYALGTLTGNVSITIDSTSEVAGMMNIYSLSFVADSTAPTITFPSSITGWAGNCLDNTTHGPVITAGKAYEFTLEGNLAVINQFEA